MLDVVHSEKYDVLANHVPFYLAKNVFHTPEEDLWDLTSDLRDWRAAGTHFDLVGKPWSGHEHSHS